MNSYIFINKIKYFNKILLTCEEVLHTSIHRKKLIKKSKKMRIMIDRIFIYFFIFLYIFIYFFIFLCNSNYFSSFVGTGHFFPTNIKIETRTWRPLYSWIFLSVYRSGICLYGFTETTTSPM